VSRAPRRVDGQALLYAYLQKDLLQNDVWLFQMLTAHLVLSLGVWLHPETYRRFPFLVRFAIRDTTYRGGPDTPERWGSPTDAALFADDNSLIKGLPRSLLIHAPPHRPYRNRRMGKGFVAAHVWGGSTAIPSTYSFVPNLVWLPSEVAKLTDRQDSFVQRYVQAVAQKLYREEELHGPLRAFVDRAWRRLPGPDGIPSQAIPSREEILRRVNVFVPDEGFFVRRRRALNAVVSGLRASLKGAPLPGRVISTRYAEGLPKVPASARRKLLRDLERYSAALPEASLADG